MGAWGPKLYQDDVAEDVKEYYKDQLRRGKTGSEITQELIRQNEYALFDQDDAPVFWFALADTQWNLGRLENFVKEQALNHIRDGHDLRRWEMENPKEAKVRAKVLSELEQRLSSPQPAEKKVSQYKLYHCEWKIGDVYAYPLDSDYAKEKGLYGRYFLVHKIGETIWHPGHTIPIVRVKITKDETLPKTEEEINASEYVQISLTRYEDRFLPIDGRIPFEKQISEKSKIKYEVDEFGFLPQYRMTLISTSKRIIPKSLIFLGDFQRVKPPQLEFVPHCELSIPSINWKMFDKEIIDALYGHNFRQYQIYSQHP